MFMWQVCTSTGKSIRFIGHDICSEILALYSTVPVKKSNGWCNSNKVTAPIRRQHPTSGAIRRFRSGSPSGTLKTSGSILNHIKALYQEIFINDLDTPTLDPKQYFVDSEKQIGLQHDDWGRSNRLFINTRSAECYLSCSASLYDLITSQSSHLTPVYHNLEGRSFIFKGISGLGVRDFWFFTRISRDLYGVIWCCYKQTRRGPFYWILHNKLSLLIVLILTPVPPFTNFVHTDDRDTKKP